MDHKDVCFEIENDDFYRRYLVGGDKYGGEDNIPASEKIEKLTAGIDKLNVELEAQVLARHPDLLSQASNTSNLESLIGSMQLDGQTLITTLEKIRSQVLIPSNILETQTDILARVQEVSFLMRHASIIINLCRKFEVAEEDLSTRAAILYEIEIYLSDYDFEGIDFLADSLQHFKKTKETIVKQASQQLQNGLTDGDKGLLLSSFKIFNSLKCAKDKIEDIVNDLLNDMRLSMRNAFDIWTNTEAKKSNDFTKTGPGKLNVMNTQIFNQKFWENTEKLFTENVFICCKKIILLQNTLNELNTFENYNFVAKNFWNKLSIMFATELKKSSITANQCAESDFPRLLKLYSDIVVKLHYKDFSIQRATLAPWENQFLSRSLERLLEPVRAIWRLNQMPNTEQIDSSIRVISSALSVSSNDKQLSVALATSVAKCVKQMVTEAEQRVCLDSDAGQIIGAPSTSQQRNAELSNILYYFSTQVLRVLTNMSAILNSDSTDIIKNSLKGIMNVSVLQPFQLSMNSAIELIVNSMHSETDLTKDDNTETVNITSSLYLRELQQFVARCKEIYLSLYQDVNAVKKCSEEIATNCIKTFVVNVCCLRPVSQYGRKKLQVDCKQLEIALQPLVSDISILDCHRQLRALYTLLGLAPDKILESQSKGGSLPYSLVMLMLFSYGGNDLPSPHICVSWSHRKMLTWLLGPSTERDRLEFIAGALQKYQAYIRQNNINKYDEVYPILLQLLDDGKKYLKSVTYD